MRTARAVQTALGLAVLLAVGGSFGLHPEPGAGAVASRAGLSTVQESAAPHGCLACLSHGAALASPLSGIILEAARSGRAPRVFRQTALGTPAGRSLSGRSPPASA